MSTFPFEAVYERLARELIGKGLPKGDLPPVILTVVVEGEHVVHVDPFPIAQMMTSPAGSRAVGALLQRYVPDLPPNACAVLISEAYVRSVAADPNAVQGEIRKQAGIPRDLKHDPQAREVVVIQLYRPGQQRTGSLPILPGRVLEYAPLEPETAVHAGRLSPDTRPQADRGPIRPTFVDAQEKQRLNPATFEAPTAEELDAVRPGWHVKVCVDDLERFWVKVATINGNKISGKVDNDLVLTAKHGLLLGDMITFERRHVYQIGRG